MSTTKTAASSAPLNINQALIAIMREVGAIGKDQRNTAQGFNFRSIDAAYNELHGIFAKYGVVSLPVAVESKSTEHMNAKGNVVRSTVSKVTYRLLAEDGTSVDAVCIGEGLDTGDKSTSKSLAICHKYLLLQSFLVATEEQKDPDYDSPQIPTENGESMEVLNERAMATERARHKRLGIDPEMAEPMEQHTKPLRTVKTPAQPSRESTEPPEAAFKNVVLTKLGHAAYKNKRIGDLSLEDLKTIQSKWVLVKAGIIAKDPIAQAQADAINEAVNYYKQGDV